MIFLYKTLGKEKSRNCETEIVKTAKALEGWTVAEEVIRNYDISQCTLYNWKSKYNGMDVSQEKRLKRRISV